MNQQPERPSDALRSDIDTTRERMDETIDALGNRLEGRHLVDEVIGFFRGRNRTGESSQLGQRISHSAETAMHSVVDTVKAHPIPAIMIGAGVGWLIYEMRSGTRYPSNGREAEADYSGYTGEAYLAEGYMSGTEEGAQGERLRDKAAGIAAQGKEKLGQVGDKARETVSSLSATGREKLGAAKEQLSHLTGDLQHRGREVYDRTRERVVSTADQHPLEVGLGCLAIGLIVGLALPTPRVVNRQLGPTVDRLRDRTRETGSQLIEKGKRVVQAAASAAKVEAKTQGLTVARVREEATAVANRAREAATETARQEGLTSAGSGSGQGSSSPAQSGAGATDPSGARPAV